MLRRTCNFVHDLKRRRILYQTLVRSQLEHCSKIWHPNYLTSMDKFENFKKKWVLFEEEMSYNSKCVLFVLNDITLFHKIFYNLIV